MRELSIELQGISLALHGYATLTYPPFLLGLALSIKALVYYPSPTLLPTLIGISYRMPNFLLPPPHRNLTLPPTLRYDKLFQLIEEIIFFI